MTLPYSRFAFTTFMLFFDSVQTLARACQGDLAMSAFFPESSIAMIAAGWLSGFVLAAAIGRENVPARIRNVQDTAKVERKAKTEILVFMAVVLLAWSVVVLRVGMLRALRNALEVKEEIGWLPGEEQKFRDVLRVFF